MEHLSVKDVKTTKFRKVANSFSLFFLNQKSITHVHVQDGVRANWNVVALYRVTFTPLTFFPGHFSFFDKSLGGNIACFNLRLES